DGSSVERRDLCGGPTPSSPDSSREPGLRLIPKIAARPARLVTSGSAMRRIPRYDEKRLSDAMPPTGGQDLLARIWKAAVPKITIVDDDESVREALKSFLKSAGFDAEAF